MTDRARTTADAPVPTTRRPKLRPPDTSRDYVRRARLLTLLDAMSAAPLTVINAGAGSGKTTLAAGWLRESTAPTAWLSLDGTDRDVTSFWMSLIAALQTMVPGCGKTAVSLLRRGRPVAEAISALSDDLETRQRAGSFLVIDDLHLVDDVDEITTNFATLVEHLPSWLRLVLLSRRDVALPRDRLLGQGRLVEIHFAQLRFSTEEAQQLLQQLDPTMAADTVGAAAARADGWAAGLRLAALAARAVSAQTSPDVILLARDSELVHDFVLHEVLAAEKPDLVNFLTDVSVVDRVNPSLGEALTGRGDAGAYLSRAEARGLFVSRLGDNGWYELHALARTALAADLAARSPVRVTDLHARAAGWFQQAGEVPLALEHWLLAGRQHEALRLLAAQHADLYDSGREATIRRTVSALRADVVSADLESMMEFAWCHLLVDRRRFLELVDQMSWWATRSSPDATAGARLTMLQSMAATINGQWIDGGLLARRAMKDLGENAWRDPLGRFGWNAVAREIAYSEAWEHGTDGVREAELALGRDPERRIAFEGTRALGLAMAGWPIDALRVAAGMRRAASISEMTILRAELQLAEAIAYREIGDRTRALALLEELARTPAETMLICQIRAAIELVRAHIQVGDIDTARRAYDSAQDLVDDAAFGVNGRDWLPQVGTQLALATGDVDLARHMSDQVDDPFWAGISIARVRLAKGQCADARSVLDLVLPRCARHQVVVRLLTALTVDDRDEARTVAAMAVEQASNAGMLQTVAAEGPVVLELVERAASQAPAQWLNRLRQAVTAVVLPLEVPRLIDPLTDRERDVLRFLPSRLTVREIADELYVSVNTLKFHLKVIYRKLGVGSRAEAAEVARRMAHLPRQH